MKNLNPILLIFVLEVVLFKKVSADFDAGKCAHIVNNITYVFLSSSLILRVFFVKRVLNF